MGEPAIGDMANPAPRWPRPLLVSLVPWLACLMAALIASNGHASGSKSSLLVTLGSVALATIAIPSAIALSSAQTNRARIVVLIALTAAGAAAGGIIGGSDEALRALVLVYPALLACFIAWVLWLRGAVARRRLESQRSNGVDARKRRAALTDRVAALSIDATVLAVGLVTPSTVLSGAGLEVGALALALITATAYFTGPTHRGRGTIGQRALRLAVIDIGTGRPPTLLRSASRSFVIAVEMLLAVTIVLGVLMLAEVMSIATSGRSLTDKLLGTDVIAL